MSSKKSGLLSRIKSKSIDILFNQSHQASTCYQHIENFENVSDEDCIKLDNINREIYRKNMELYEMINKKIENRNAMFKIDTPPQPPQEPNNHEKYISYKLRNVHHNVRHQTLAVCYLLSKGYRLYFDKPENKNEMDFEPYEAIELFQRLENMPVDNAIKNKNYELYLFNNAFGMNNIGYNRSSMNIPHYFNNEINDINNGYLRLSSSAPSTYGNIIPTAPPLNIPNTPEINRHVSGPPALHYIDASK